MRLAPSDATQFMKLEAMHLHPLIDRALLLHFLNRPSLVISTRSVINAPCRSSVFFFNSRPHSALLSIVFYRNVFIGRNFYFYFSGFIYHASTCQTDTIGSGYKNEDERCFHRISGKLSTKEREVEPFSFYTMGTRSLQLP